MTQLDAAAPDPPESEAGGGIPPSRARVRIVVAWVPWLLFAPAVTAVALWWTQRRWSLRLAGCGVLVAWSIAWCWSALRSKADSRLRAPLIIVAASAAGLGLQGAVLGLAPVPVVISAWLAAFGSLLFAVAALGSPLARAKAITAAVSAILALAGLEASARVLGIGATARESDSLELARRFNNLTPPRSAFVNKPKPLDEFPPASIEINSIGVRGPEVPQGPVSLLLLGDSFIEARQLPWEQTLGPRLQAALHARSSDARVVSHGMRGWSPLLEWNWYLKVGRRFRAERVLLFFFWNDLLPAGTEVQLFRAVLGPDGRPDHFDVLLDSGWLWYRHVRTVRLVEEFARLVQARAIRFAVPSAPLGSVTGDRPVLDEERAKTLARSMADGPPFSAAELDALVNSPLASLPDDLQRVARTGFWPGIRPLALWTQDQIAAAAVAERELGRFAQDVYADGGRLVIVYVPNPYQAGSGECTVGRYLDRLDAGVNLPADSGVQAWLRTITAKHGIEFLDPTDAMRAWDLGRPASNGQPLYLRADCHWSPRGQEFMADWLAAWYLSGSSTTK